MLTQSRHLWLVYALVVLSACASLQTDQSSVETRLDQAQVVESAAKRLAASLVDSNAITADEAEAVLVTCRTVAAAVDAGRAYLAAGNAGGAEGQLAGVFAALTKLSAFYLDHKGARP